MPFLRISFVSCSFQNGVDVYMCLMCETVVRLYVECYFYRCYVDVFYKHVNI